MLKNFDIPFLDYEGKPIKENDKEAQIRTLIINAIQSSSDNQTVTGEEKFARFKLCEKISKGGDVEISIEDAAMIKKCVGSGVYTPLAVGRVYDLLEGKGE